TGNHASAGAASSREIHHVGMRAQASGSSPMGATRTPPLMPNGATMRPKTIMEVDPCSGCRLDRLLDQAGDSRRQERAVLFPVLETFGVDDDRFLRVGSNRVEKPYALNKAPVTT